MLSPKDLLILEQTMNCMIVLAVGNSSQRFVFRWEQWSHLGSCPPTVHQQKAVSDVRSLFRVYDY